MQLPIPRRAMPILCRHSTPVTVAVLTSDLLRALKRSRCNWLLSLHLSQGPSQCAHSSDEFRRAFLLLIIHGGAIKTLLRSVPAAVYTCGYSEGDRRKAKRKAHSRCWPHTKEPAGCLVLPSTVRHTACTLCACARVCACVCAYAASAFSSGVLLL